MILFLKHIIQISKINIKYKMKSFNLSITRKILALNTTSLFFIYGINFLLSLINLPRLISIYGVNTWGEITFMQIIINYLIWITDWSFPQFSCKLISINETDKKSQQKIFTQTITSQSLLLLFSTIVLILLSIFFYKYKIAFLSSILILFGNFLQPYWYLNGREKIYESALFQLLNKTIFSLLIFSPLLKYDKSYIYFLLYGIATLLTGILLSMRLMDKYKISYKLRDFKKALTFIKESLFLFVSSALGNITSSIIPITISNFFGIRELGIYNIADRIKNISIQIINPLTHSIFPRMAKYYYKDKKNANRKFILLCSFLIILSTIIFILLNTFIDTIILYFSKENIYEITRILRILSFSFIINILYETFINQYLVVNNFFYEINKGKLIILCTCIFIGLPFIFIKGIYGAAITNLIYESVGLIYVAYVFVKTKNRTTFKS